MGIVSLTDDDGTLLLGEVWVRPEPDEVGINEVEFGYKTELDDEGMIPDEAPVPAGPVDKDIGVVVTVLVE